MSARKIAAIAAATLATTAIVATVPTAAHAASRGTATVSEARKVVREADRQRCLTLSEARKIVHGTGTEYAVEGPTRGFRFTGKGEVRNLYVTVVHGCADFVAVDYRHNRTLVWSDWNVGIGSPESYV